MSWKHEQEAFSERNTRLRLVWERRRSPRMKAELPALVVLRNSERHRDSVEAAVMNISSSGAFLRVPQKLGTGSRIFSVIRFSEPGADQSGARLAVSGLITRVVALGEKDCGIGVRFSRRRLI